MTAERDRQQWGRLKLSLGQRRSSYSCMCSQGGVQMGNIPDAHGIGEGTMGLFVMRRSCKAQSLTARSKGS